MFRPFEGQIIEARVQRSTRAGVHLTLGFFDQVFVPACFLPQPSSFNEETGTWEWRPNEGDDDEEEDEEANGRVKNEDENEGGEEMDEEEEEEEEEEEVEDGPEAPLLLETKDPVLFRVMQISVSSPARSRSGRARVSPKPSGAWGAGDSVAGHSGPQMQIIASMLDQGLGVKDWWEENDEEDDEEDEEEEEEGEGNGEEQGQEASNVSTEPLSEQEDGDMC